MRAVTGILTLLGAVAGAGLALAALLWLLQPYLLFQPGIAGQSVDRTPAAAGLAYEDVRLRTADGVRIAGWYVAGPREAAPVVLFLHGNAGNIGHRLESIEQFHRAGAAVLIVDYRGYGNSEGRPSERGTYADARAAWRWLTRERGVPPRRIVVFGRSLGGAVAARLAGETRPAGLIVEATFTSLPELAADLYPWLPARWLTRYAYDAARYLEEVECPVMVAHARADEIVPFAHARRLAAIRPPVVELVELDGGHNDAFLASQPRYTRTLASFLRRVTGDHGDGT